MDRPFQPATRVRGALLVADISGYTGFLQGVADAHRAIIVEADEPPAAYVVQRVAGRDEILGAEVNAVHRLLKHHAREVVGERPYALITDATLAALEVPIDGMAAMTERYDDLPPIPVHVLALDRP
jgi:hypothetical protein